MDPCAAPDFAGDYVARVVVHLLGYEPDNRSAVYVSAPITTGRRFVEWRRNGGSGLKPGTEQYEYERRLQVIEPNCAEAAVVVNRVCKQLGGIVIDPTQLDVHGWSQASYHEFWTHVVQRYAHTVVLIDGWEYSSGCTKEFLAALSVGLTLLAEDLSPMSAEAARAVIIRALESLEQDRVLPVAPLLSTLERLEPPC